MRDMLLLFTPSLSSDVVSYNVAIKASAYDEPVVSAVVPVADLVDVDAAPGQKAINLSGLEGVQGLDGTFIIELYAIDDAENPSENAVLEGVEIDFLAPTAPTNLSIIRL